MPHAQALKQTFDRAQTNRPDADAARHEFSWRGATPGASLYLAYVRQIPNHPFKLRLTRYIARKFFPKGVPLAAPNGAQLALNASDYIPHSIISTGIYERKSLALALRIMAEEGGTFLDVGSNFGLYTCTVGTLDGVKCIAVEPSSEAFRRLAGNVSRNPKLDVELVHLGLAAANSIHSLELPVVGNLGTSRIALDDEDRAPPHTNSRYHIGCFTLDDVLSQISGVGKIKLLKIDVEGYEMEVFKGLNLYGAHRPENIIAEFSDYMNRANYTTSYALNYFRDHGYDAYTVEGAPVERPRELPEDNIWFKSR